MNLMHSAKVLLGKALRPLHAGEEQLLALQREVTPARGLVVHSEAFPLGGVIPRRHAGPGEGENLSPALEWSGVPPQARDLILVCEDPDAPALHPFIHWMMKIPPTATKLPEALAPTAALAHFPGLVQGLNSANQLGYYGPLPPPGHGPHHYYFQLFALDQPIALPESADRNALLNAMTGHVLAEGHYVGVYERS
jgi:Raf kinase inhibitor-like YbhB/YbcL family protein